MHIVHGELRKAPFVKVLQDSTMFAVELSELIKDYKTGEKTYTNYKAILFAKSEAHVNHYNQTLVEGNFIVITSEKLKLDVSPCGQYTKLFMDNSRLEGSGYIKGNQQAPQQQAPQQQQAQQVQPQQMQQAPTMAQQAAQHPQAQPMQQQPQPQNGFAPANFDDDLPY